ncbi:anthranilate synthase component II [Adhaeretor mobilis]|uniref:Aminodeoxychorismate synthase component 2 n=1 Tax=Adhaeretor mobilis TaxID=1930276 RepID=A0A517MW94_9BACT|nr:aminodeoxychorismate/anthranilate synthase component II [Adhaeretor mobilis]QDS99151.1 Aminodeoxychorismate synthase component 2 [Adhaeretor mobilis]
MVLLVDNYDSFVHNLARYFELLGQETHVVRNDKVNAASVRSLKAQAIVLSPGPCAPSEAGYSLELVREFHQEVPLLGICLGHQTLGAAMGAKVVRASEPRHGRTSEIEHAGQGVFQGVPSPLTVCRYHSLIVDEDSLPEELEIIARSTGDGTIMGLAHRDFPTIGLQFHPEAILTGHGFQLLANFLELADIKVTADPTALAAREDRSPPPRAETVGLSSAPTGPITF